MFLSAGRDKTVKLWSLQNYGNGSAACGPQLTYTLHQKQVIGLQYLDLLRWVASCGTSLHVSSVQWYHLKFVQ